ncbi:MAG: hypothetical protein CMJ49_05865 [Planctomycetaceae bacterium]|nr:hypothetical protein [Planctomycetaceae bacterium]
MTDAHDPALHLFVDDHHIRNFLSMKRVFGAATRHPQPALTDIAGRTIGWGCVISEQGKHRLWYESGVPNNCHDLATAGVWGRGADYAYHPDRHPDAVPEYQASVLSYAESADGFTWTRPDDLGLIEWQGSTANNIVMDGSSAAQHYDNALTHLDSPSVVRDDDAPAEQRYKFIAHWASMHAFDNSISDLNRPDADMQRFWAASAKYITTSPDGIHWHGPPTRLKEHAGGGDYSGVTRDHRNQRWWYNDRARHGLWGPTYIRTAGLCSSPSLDHWPQHVEQLFPLAETEDFGARYEHHGMVPFNYGDQDLGFLELSTKGKPKASLLVSHHDGGRWRRVPDAPPILECGPPGSIDSWIVLPTRNAPLLVGDEMIITYNGRRTSDHDPTLHHGCLCLAKMRRDAFVGMQVDRHAAARHDRPALLQTQPVAVTVDTLALNIEQHRGTARAALFDEAAEPIDGFSLDDCLPIDEDNTRAPVRWKNADLRQLIDRRVILLIEIQAGIVWSFRL